MKSLTLAVGAVVLGVATMALAQDTAYSVWGVRVLATDVDATASFYAKTFGMSEVARPVNSATTKELVLNFGRTPEMARRATTPPIGSPGTTFTGSNTKCRITLEFSSVVAGQQPLKG